jgi:hypothetical protein
VIGHLEAEIVFLIFHRKTSCAGTTGRYSTGETPPIKAERPGSSDHLRSTCTRINTIYEYLNESSSARLGGSQQLEILPGAELFLMNFDRHGNLRDAVISCSNFMLIVRSLSVSFFIEKEPHKQLRMKRKRRGER